MKKFIDRWGKYTVYAFSFKNPVDFCDYVRNAKINTKIFPMNIVKRNGGSEGSNLTYNGGGWYQTKNINQAINLCLDGWHEGYDFFKSLKNTLDYRGDKMTILSKSKKKPINILVNLSYSWETTKNQVVNRGVIIQNLVNELEKNGYKVLKTFALTYYDNEISCIVVSLKSIDERLDPRKAYFSFCNPSFLRRLVFRVMESSDFKKTGWNENYGFVCESDFIKKAFSTGKFDIVIPQPSEIGITGGDIVKDWRQFLIYENLQDCFEF